MTQKLHNVLHSLFGVIAIESEMFEIIDAIKEDLELSPSHHTPSNGGESAEEFLKDVCPNHTNKSTWNKSELLHILGLHSQNPIIFPSQEEVEKVKSKIKWGVIEDLTILTPEHIENAIDDSFEWYESRIKELNKQK